MTAGVDSPVLDYTSLDYASVRADLLRYSTALGTDLTDLNPSDPFVLLVSLLAYVADLLAYTMNQGVLEMVPTLAIRRENFQRSVKKYGYKLGRRQGSSGTLRFTVNYNDTSPVGGPFNLPQTFRVSTADGIIFQPNALTVVGPGVGTVTVDITGSQGEWLYAEAVGTSDGAESQQYALREVGLVESSLSVTVGGTPWTRVELLALETSADTSYAVAYDDDDVAYIIFGDGINGQVPAALSAIVATYKTLKEGEDGNIAAGNVDTLVDSIPGVEAVTNPAAFSWSDVETLQEAQAALPGWVRINDRIVTDADYAEAVKAVAGVLKAAAGVGSGGGCGCGTTVYVVPSSGGSISAGLVADITAAIATQRMVSKKVRIVDATYVDLVISVDLRILSTALSSLVKTSVENLIADTYDVGSRDFGDFLALQSLYDLLAPSKVRGLAQAFVQRFTVTPQRGVYPALQCVGNGDIENIVMETPPKRFEWSVKVLIGGSASVMGTFEVYKRYVGTVSSLTDVAMNDDLATFPETNGLVVANPWYLVLNPYGVGATRKRVVGNTQTSVTADSADLRYLGLNDDEYVVEQRQAASGKILREVLAGVAAGGATVLNVVNAGWAIGDRFLITEGTITHEGQITGGSSGAWTITPAIPASGFTVAATVDAVWQSDDAEIRFVVRQGATTWVTGDQCYVDSYPDLSDLKIRTTDFPRLQSAGLTIRTTGGRTS